MTTCDSATPDAWQRRWPKALVEAIVAGQSGRCAIASEQLTRCGDNDRSTSLLPALEHNLEGFLEQCDVACSGGPGRDCVVFKEMAKPDEGARS